MNEQPYKRSFFGAVAAGAAASAFPTSAHAKPKLPTTDLIRVGVIALNDNSHMNPNYSIWPQTINPTEPDRWPYGRTTRMLITHCWDKDPAMADLFAKKYNCTAVKNYYDMVGKVDGMIFAGFNECEWWPRLTEPYLKAGIPCYINRPFAYSMKDAKYMVELSKKHNAPILCTDEREYIKEAMIARARVRSLLAEGKNIVGANSVNAAGEWSQHGVHGLYYLLAILGMDVGKVSLQADGWWREVTPTAHQKMSWALLTLQYNGISIDDVERQQTKPFTVSQQHYGPYNAGIRLYYDGGWWDDAHKHVQGERQDRLYYLFFPTVLAIQRLFETREMQWSHDYILRKTQIFLAAFKSHLDHDGALIDVDSLHDDWQAPSPYPDWLDKNIFQ